MMEKITVVYAVDWLGSLREWRSKMAVVNPDLDIWFVVTAIRSMGP